MGAASHSFHCCFVKMHWQEPLVEETLILAHGLKVRSTMVGKSRCQELSICRITSANRKWRAMSEYCCSAQYPSWEITPLSVGRHSLINQCSKDNLPHACPETHVPGDSSACEVGNTNHYRNLGLWLTLHILYVSLSDRDIALGSEAKEEKLNSRRAEKSFCNKIKGRDRSGEGWKGTVMATVICHNFYTMWWGR